MIRTAHHRLSNQSGSGVSPLCLGIMTDSPTIASHPSPSSIFTAHFPPNVRKCPVLSGPTDSSGETGASTDSYNTYDQNPSHPDRTLTGHQPAQPPQPQTPTQASQTHNVRKCPVLSGLTDSSGEIDASTDIQTTYDQTTSHPDRTSTSHQPASPRPECRWKETGPVFASNDRYTPGAAHWGDSWARSHWPYHTVIADAPLP